MQDEMRYLRIFHGQQSPPGLFVVHFKFDSFIAGMHNHCIQTIYMFTRYTFREFARRVLPSPLAHHKGMIDMFTLEAQTVLKILLPEQASWIDQHSHQMLTQVSIEIIEKRLLLLNPQRKGIKYPPHPKLIRYLNMANNDRGNAITSLNITS